MVMIKKFSAGRGILLAFERRRGTGGHYATRGYLD